MSPYQVGLWVLVVAGSAFLFAGFVLLVFGQRVSSSASRSAKVELSIVGNTIRVPYSISIVACIVGILLMLILLDVLKGGEPRGERASLHILASAHAQPPSSFSAGWVYLGYEGSPQLWNFQIIGGSYADLRKGKEGLLLKSLKDVNIRGNHFGNLTGTVLGFLDPEPRVIGSVPQGACGEPSASVSVGRDKVWVRIVPAICTQ